MAQYPLTNVPTTVSDPQLRLFLQQVKDSITTFASRAELAAAQAGLLGGAIGDLKTVVADTTKPKGVTGLTTSASFGGINLTWAPVLSPQASTYQRGVSHIEVWRSTSQYLAPSLDPANGASGNFEFEKATTAVLLGVAKSDMYVDYIDDASVDAQLAEIAAHASDPGYSGPSIPTYYYWVRAISTGGTKGPISGAASGTPPYGVEGHPVTRPENLLALLNHRLTESQLYTTLGDKITLIPVLQAQLSSTQSALTSTTSVVSGHSASLTSLTASLSSTNSNLTAVQQQTNSNSASITSQAASISAHSSSIASTQALVTPLSAQWTTKTQVGELVGGIGFYNNGSTTQFYVAANNFSVYSPGSTSLSFAVNNGKVVMDGAFIKDATITNAAIYSLNVSKLVVDNRAYLMDTVIGVGSITNAYIGDTIESSGYIPGVTGWHLSKTGASEFQSVKVRGDVEASSLKAGTAMVDTLNVAGNAITANYYSASSGGGATIASLQTVSNQCPMVVTMPSNSSGCIFIATVTVSGATNPSSGCTIKMYQDGTLVNSTGTSVFNGYGTAFTVSFFVPNPSGTHTYSIAIMSDYAGRDLIYWGSSLICMGGKR